MRDAFAGVRDAGHEYEDTDLTCCAYGRSCIIFDDSDLAASIDCERHLQAWLGNEDVLVDRYDVRLLLHDSTQLIRGPPRGGFHSFDTDSLEEDLEYERYRDMNRENDSRSLSPDPASPAPTVSDAEPEPEARSSAAYTAVPFVYDPPDNEAVQVTAHAAVSKVPAAAVTPDIPFTPTFAIPSSVKSHLPRTDRMHKIILQTAKFVRQAGGQTEFVLRVKQAANPNFSFLEPNDEQHPYFRWLVSTRPEDMLTIDAAPSSAAGSSHEEALPTPPSIMSPAKDPFTANDAAPAQLTPHHEQASEQIAGTQENASASHAQAQSTAPSQTIPASSSSVPLGHVQPKSLPSALPAADMQALAKRISLTGRVPSNPAEPEINSSTVSGDGLHGVQHGPQQLHTQAQAVLPSRPVSTAVSAAAMAPAEIQAIIQKLVHFIKKAGPKFEATVRNKEKANPRFAFLLPWNQHHSYYRLQLVEILGQDAADEVIAMRGQLTADAPAGQSQAAAAGPASKQPKATNGSRPHIQGQAAASELHDQAAAAIPQDSQLAQALACTNTDLAAATSGRDAQDQADDAPKPDLPIEHVSSDLAGVSEGDNADVAQTGPAGETAVDTVAPSSKLASSGVTSVRSNPRFASKPVKEELVAVQPVVEANKAAASAEDKAGAHASATHVTQEAADLPIKKETAVQPIKDRVHAAHAAALSLESVIEAQSALLQERHQRNQPDMTEEEKKAHRRRLVRQMLEAKQKSEAEAEEQRRKTQQSALAKYRQAWASDTEEEVIHMKLEDDEEYEAPEPGEIVDKPEEKAVSGPVLSAPPPSPLPSLEALIRPRQDLVYQQRVFPLSSSGDRKPSSQLNARGSRPSTGTASSSSDSEHSGDESSRRGKHRHKRSHRRSSSSSSDADSGSYMRRKHNKHKRRRRPTSRRKHSSRHKRRRSKSSSQEQSASRSPSRGSRKRSRHDDSADDIGDSSADALRAKVRAMLGNT